MLNFVILFIFRLKRICCISTDQSAQYVDIHS